MTGKPRIGNSCTVCVATTLLLVTGNLVAEESTESTALSACIEANAAIEKEKADPKAEDVIASCQDLYDAFFRSVPEVAWKDLEKEIDKQAKDLTKKD